ncbi:MAG TPA: S9 family peptidase [Candidatus Sulfotelmatobacter sp.]|nr:S9 family peptidase [Candidatus Sulfotelmatobacter sp.]
MKSYFLRLCAAITFCCGLMLLAAHGETRSRAAAVLDSMPHAKNIQQAVISPDGTQVAYIMGGELSVIAATGGTPRSIAVDGKLSLRDVAWSPDSKQLVFLADLPGEVPSAQLWTAVAGGSAPVKHADLKGYAAAPTFSPDGTKLALLFTEGLPRAAGPLQPMLPLAGVIDEQVYEQRLTTVDLSNNTLTSISPADMYVYEYDWMPDGHGWAAIAAHGAGDANWYIAHLYHVDGRSHAMHDIYTPKLQIAEPRVSRDGKHIAFIEGLMSDEGSVGGEIYALSLSGSGIRDLTPKIPSSPASLVWTSADRILFGENIDGKSGFGSVSLSDGKVQQIWSGDESVNAQYSIASAASRDGSVSAVVRQSASTPPELWAGPIGKWQKLTAFNEGVKPAWGEEVNFHWTNGDFHLEGWLMLPVNYDESKKYPLIVNVHGGPSAACGARWDSMTMGAASAMGYFSFCPNPRGSYGQGEAFTQANVKDFGGGDFRDIMAGVDAIAKKYPIDEKRLGIRGHSYGGYMTMWAETQTHRFAAAVAGAGLSDWLSYYGVNDIDEWMIPFFGASIYDDPAVYAKSDPMHFVKNVKTPTLILVGDRDGEVPVEQSIEWWHALKDLHVPVKFVVYPNEGHVFIRPGDWHDYFLRSLEWFDEWFGKAGG